MSGKQMHTGHNHEASIEWPETTHTQPLPDTGTQLLVDEPEPSDSANTDDVATLEPDPEVALKEHIVELENMIPYGTLDRTLQMLEIARGYAVKADADKTSDHPSANSRASLAMSEQALDGAVAGLVSTLGSYENAEIWVSDYLSTVGKLG